MRWIRDIVLLLVLAAIASGVAYYRMGEAENDAAVEKTAADLRRLGTEIRYRAATKNAELNARAWPITVSPDWFDKSEAPINAMLDDEHPWVEVAPPEMAGFTHPPVRMAINHQLAGFWYNPYQGIVRARVPVMVSDQSATDLYNRINASTIPSIHWTEKPQMIPNVTDDQGQLKAGADTEAKPRENTTPAHEPAVVVVRKTRPKR